MRISRPTRRYRHFTLLEMLFVIASVAIIVKMLMPAFAESRSKARFVRWLAFNRQCSNDPTCVVNFNFQDGEGRILYNSAIGNQEQHFDSREYQGVVNGNYKWVQGRWWRGKRALQFNGNDTYVEVEQQKALNFGEEDGFTIIIWVKFDRLRRYDGLFSKSWMAGAVGWAQYDLYTDFLAYDDKQASGQFEVDVCTTCIGFDDVVINEDESTTPNIKLDTENWFMLTLRNKPIDGESSSGGLSGGGKSNEVDVFFNGKRLAPRSTNNYVSRNTKCDANLIIGAIRFLGGTVDNPTKEGRIRNFFKGRVDEFLVYSRALEDTEIMGHYRMGAEHY